MGFWAWAAVVVVVALVVWSFFWVMGGATDNQGVRLGAWAQFFGSFGTVAAAVAAWRTAVVNREQARETNKALAHSTRPQLTINMRPEPSKAGTLHAESHYWVTVNNYSPFDVPRGVAYWTLRDGSRGQVRFGPLPSEPYDQPGPFDGAVLTVGEKRPEPHLVLDLGLHRNFERGEDNLTIHYVSPFGDGGWIELHVWRTENQGTEDDPKWKSERFIDSATWASLSEMDIRPDRES